MSIETQVAELVANTTKLTERIEGQADEWDEKIQKKEDEVDALIGNYKIEKHINVGLEYVPILKFRSQHLSSVFRIIIAGVSYRFVFAGIFDVVCSHARIPMIQLISSTRYGSVVIKIDYDYNGNGYVSMKKISGDDIVSNMKIVCCPYNGSVVFYENEVPVQDNTIELDFTEAGV